MQSTFDRYYDPGHSWLRVPKQLLIDIGIAADISPYSYEAGKHAYLEEDGDMTMFEDTMRRVHGIDIKVHEHSTNRESRIRTYNAYKRPSTMLTDEQLKLHFAGCNAITPYIIEYGHAPKQANIIYELSHGKGLSGETMYGVSVRLMVRHDFSAYLDDLCKAFYDQQEAYDYIRGLTWTNTQ